jgi:hypothetical protein
VGRSATPDLLRYSDVEWMRRMARGAHLLAVVVVVRIAFRNTILRLIETEVTAILLTLGLAAFWTIAIWECTRSDPGHRPEPSVERARLGARILLIGAALFEIAVVAGDPVALVDSILPATVGGAGLLGWAFDTTTTVCALLGFFLILTWACSLADRIPDAGLATNTRTTRKGLAWCYGILVIVIAPWNLIALGKFLPPRVARVADTLASIAEGGATIGLLIFTIMAIVLLFRYRAAFVKAASESSEHWA